MTEQGSSPPNLSYPAWQREYEASLHEGDPEELLERVQKAEAAIFNRLQELAATLESTNHKGEEQETAEALRMLRVLKRDNLRFPDSQTE